MKPLAAALFLCLASAAFAQDAYENKDLKFRFRLPSADYELKAYEKTAKGEWWGWGDTFCEMRAKGSAEAPFSGVLLYSSAGWTTERYMKWREEEWKKNNQNVKREKDEVLDKRKPGNWRVVEWSLEYKDTGFRYVHLFVQKAKHNFELMLWCTDGLWEDARPLMYKVIESVEYEQWSAEKPSDPKPSDPKPSDPQPAAGGTPYTHKDLGVGLTVPDGFDIRESGFKLGDNNAVLEFQKGDDAFGTLAAIDFDGSPKAWADASIQAFEKSMQNLKVLDAKTAGEWERRDFRADTNGVAVRFAIIFHVIPAKKKGVYLYVWSGEGDWGKFKDVFEGTIASVKTGGGGAKPADPKPSDPKPADPTPAAGDGVAVPEDMWKGFGAGTTVTYKMNSAGTEMQMTHELVEHKEGESYTVRTDMVMGGNKIPGQNQKYVVRKPEPGKDPAPAGEKPQIEDGEETIKVPKGEFKCKWTKTTTKQGWSKVWSCEDVPMRMVKMESESGGMKTTMELMDFVRK